MDIDGNKLKRAYRDEGYTQESLADQTRRVDPDGKGVCSKTISRGCAEEKLDESSVELIAKALGKDKSFFAADDPRPLDASSREFATSEFILDAIDSGDIGLQYWGEEEPGECLWTYIKEEIKGERIRRHFSDQDFADGIDRLKRMNVLVELSDKTIRVVRPDADEVLDVLDMRLEQEIKAMKKACRQPPEMRSQIAREQHATWEECCELLEREAFKDLVVTEASWHHAWAGDQSSKRRLLRSNLNLAMQVGDRMLTAARSGRPSCREERFKREFATMLEELRQMHEIFVNDADPQVLKDRIITHVGRSKRIICEVEKERRDALKKARSKPK
jgi:DNA-binding GntR family transcriptional regulator